MFKPGDKVIAVKNRGGEEKSATVVVTRKSSSCVVTSEGTFDESELSQAHPSVIDTASNKNTSEEEEEEEEEEDTENCASNKLRIDLKLTVFEAVSDGTLDTDIRGHWKNGNALSDEWLTELFRPVLQPHDISTKDATDLLNVLKFNAKNKDNKHSLNRFVTVGVSMGTFDCTYCESRTLPLETNGETIRLPGDPCSYPNGFELNEWELNVPSGKIVVTNDLRRWFPFPDGDSDRNLNTVAGTRAMAIKYANIGMSHAFVGNSCPSVFRTSSGAYKIASEPEQERWDEEKNDYVPREPEVEFDGERLAGICTDLWWYSIVDFDELARRTEKFGGSIEDVFYGATIIDVKPGVYRFKHDDEANRGNHGGDEIIYTTFDWVRDPDPTKDYLSEYEQVEVNAHAYVQAQAKEWPSLYAAGCSTTTTSWSDMTEEQRLNSWQSVANHIFCTIGSGTEWHEKGFPTAVVDPNIPDIEPPSLREQYPWYPFSKGYGGLFKDDKPVLAPSFAKLAFRVLESIISFGMRVDDNRHARNVPQIRQCMLEAVDKYRKLAQIYPKFADPEYVSWLSKEGRAEAWVARFDLGEVYTQRHLDDQASQRWVPEDTYAIEFDANKLGNAGDHYVGSTGCWSDQKNATGYAIEEHTDNGLSDSTGNFWAGKAGRTAIPLCSVARVVKLGEVSHMGNMLIELSFDYGTEWMQDTSVRKAINELQCKKAVRLLNKKEYDAILADKRNMGK